jgi:hypothetical protein
MEHFTLYQIFFQKGKMYSLMWRNTCNYLMFFIRSLSRCSVKPWRISSALCELIGVRGAVDPAGGGGVVSVERATQKNHFHQTTRSSQPLRHVEIEI